VKRPEQAPSPAVARLEKRLQDIQGSIPEASWVRLYRSLSWLRASEAMQVEDERFIALWISFNALYGGSDFIAGTREDKGKKPSEKKMFHRFLSDLADCNQERIWKVLAEHYEDCIRSLIDNKYAYFGFWRDEFSKEPDEKQSERHFRDDMNRARKAFSQRNMRMFGRLVFERLYVVRNQLFHGAATYGSSLNRPQVRASCRLMAALVPVILETVLDILRDNPDYDRWGRLPYPPLDRGA